MEVIAPTRGVRRPGLVTIDLLGLSGFNSGRIAGNLPDMDYTNDFSGTSAATPLVAGVVALMLSVNPDLSRDEALALLVSSADKVRPALAQYDAGTGFSLKYGYGRVNAREAVRAAQVHRKYTRGDKSRGRRPITKF